MKSPQTPPRKPRDRSVFRLALGMIGGSLLLASLSIPLIEHEISIEASNSDALAQISMQRTTDVLADKTRSLLGSLDTLVRLASLWQRTAQCCAPNAASLVQEALRDAVNQNPLGVRSLTLLDVSGRIAFTLGEDPSGAPIDEKPQLGPGLPWRTRSGSQVAHIMRLMPDLQGWVLRATIDLNVLATASEVALPNHATASLLRLSDGAILTSLPVSATQILVGPAPPVRYADAATVVAFNRNDRGWLTGGWSPTGSSNGGNFAFVSMPELGLVIAATLSQNDLIAAASSRAQSLRFIPVIALLVSMVATVGGLVIITRRRAQAELEQEQRMAAAESAARAELEDLVACSPAMLYRGSISSSGKFYRAYLTPNTEEVTGWRPASLSDEDIAWQLLPDEDRYLVEGNYARALREGRSAVEYRCQRPDGTMSWLRNEVVVVSRHADGSADVAGAITNISREREMSAYAAMQNRLATLGEISASLAHELTQPMTVIGIAAAIAQGLIPKSDSDSEMARQLGSIVSQSDRASDIIRHLRAYGRADNGPLIDVSLGVAANGALSLAGMSLREAEIEVTVDIPADLPPVRARQVQVEQVIVNLLINARDAMGATPSSARRIVLRGTTTAKSIRLEIEDTGPGVPASLIERLFEPFYTTKAPGEGTGLGLSLCQAMMQQFGGSITAANGRYGAVFSLDFPNNRPLQRQEPAIIAASLDD